MQYECNMGNAESSVFGSWLLLWIKDTSASVDLDHSFQSVSNMSPSFLEVQHKITKIHLYYICYICVALMTELPLRYILEFELLLHQMLLYRKKKDSSTSAKYNVLSPYNILPMLCREYLESFSHHCLMHLESTRWRH